MSQTTQIGSGQSDQTFARPQGCRGRAYLAFAGAAACVLVAIAGFLAALHSGPNMIQFQAMTTIPMLMAVGLGAFAVRSLRTPSLVCVTDQDLQVTDSKAATRKWTWDQITFAETTASSMGAQCLTIHGTSGRPIVRLSGDFGRFDVMVESIQRRMAEHPAPNRAAARTKKAKKTGAFLVIGGLLAWSLAGVNSWIALSDREAQQLLKERGTTAVATVVEKRIAPDGRTHRVSYRVDDPNGKSGTGDVEIDPIAWQLAKVGKHINVVTVPGRPDISRLAAGQIDDNMHPEPGTMLLLSCGIFVLGGVFLIGGVLNWRGINVKYDTKTGFHTERVGQ